MEHFINIVFDEKQEVDDIVVSEVATSASNALLEEETGYELYDTNEGKTVLTVETHVQLDELESNEVAEKVANKLFDLGYNNFDIEASLGIKSISYDLKNTENTTNDINVPNIHIKISKDLFKTSDDGVTFLTPIYVFGYAKTEDQSDNPIFDLDLVPQGVNTLMNK